MLIALKLGSDQTNLHPAIKDSTDISNETPDVTYQSGLFSSRKSSLPCIITISRTNTVIIAYTPKVIQNAFITFIFDNVSYASMNNIVNYYNIVESLYKKRNI